MKFNKTYKNYLFFLLSIFVFTNNLEAVMPLELKTALTYRIITYNKTITKKETSIIKIGILEGTNQEQIFSKFTSLMNSKTISGKNIEIIKIESIKDAKDLDVLYVTNGNDNNLDIIISFCNENKIMTICSDLTYVKKGIIIGLILERDKPKIVINTLTKNKSEVIFSAELMKLAKLI